MMINNKFKLVAVFIPTLLLLFCFSQSAFPQKSKLFGRMSVGIEIGSWKPNKLYNKREMSSLFVKGASPFWGVFLLSPELGDWTLKGGIGYWKQTCLKNMPDTESVTIIHFMLSLKQTIIPEFRLTPFVSYGFAFSLGSENETCIKQVILHKKNEAGFGVNVGAGFDFLITKHWFTGIEFSYHYIKFNQAVGMTNDYSGPKFSANLYYSF